MPIPTLLRTWCPELARVPPHRVHEPWLMSREEQEAAGCRIGVDYPAPIPASQHAKPHAAAFNGAQCSNCVLKQFK